MIAPERGNAVLKLSEEWAVTGLEVDVAAVGGDRAELPGMPHGQGQGAVSSAGFPIDASVVAARLCPEGPVDVWDQFTDDVVLVPAISGRVQILRTAKSR